MADIGEVLKKLFTTPTHRFIIGEAATSTAPDAKVIYDDKLGHPSEGLSFIIPTEAPPPPPPPCPPGQHRDPITGECVPDVPTPPEVMKAQIVAVNASSQDVGKEAGKAADGDFETRWSADGVGEWIEFTFNQSYKFKILKLTGYHYDKTYTFDIGGKSFVCPAGRTPNTLVEFDISSLNLDTDTVRIIGKGNNSTTYNSYREIEFFGIPGTPPPVTAVIKPDTPTTTPGQTIALDATKSSGLPPLKYAWTKLTGDFEILTPSSALTSVKIPDTAQVGSSVVIGLTVTDSKGTSATTQKQISVIDIPPPPPPGEKVFIGQVGDTHGNHKVIQEMISKYNPFIIHTGDVTDTESTDDGYIAFMKSVNGVYGKNFANSEGNHESKEEGGEGAKALLEAAYPTLKENEWLQFYHIKNVVIIIGNTQAPGYSQLDSNAGKWLKDTALPKAKQLVDSGQADWIIYAQHKPVYTLKARHESEFNFRYNFHPLMDQAGVDITVHGHNHDQQRTLPIKYGGPANAPPIINDRMKDGAHDMSGPDHGLVVHINGSSTKLTSFSESPNAWTPYANDTKNGYSIFEIEGKNLIGRFIEIGTGKILHEYKLTKESGTNPPPPPPPDCPPGQHRDPQTGQCVPDSPPPPPPPPPNGELDEFGTRMLYKTTGKKVDMQKGTDHRNGQRYNVNHKFTNYMMIGYFKTGKGQELIEMKTDGPNHSGCSQLPNCMWYEPHIDVNTGKVSLGGEWPHPTNHNDLKTDFTENLKKPIKETWVGYAVVGYTSPAGNRVIEQWDALDPFGSDGKPTNNWHMNLKVEDTKGKVFPAQYHPRMPPVNFNKGLESEIRMHKGINHDTEMKFCRVYEIIPPTT